jgi:hypothetical protein
MDLSVFFREANRTILRAVLWLGVSANLDLRPQLIAKAVRRRCVGEMRRLAVLVRRLIFLMAVSLELEGLAPGEGRNYFCSERKPGAKRWRGLRLVPGMSGVFSGSLRASSGHVPEPRLVPAAPVMERWQHLLDALKQSHRRAKRLARTLQRWKARGEARPYVAPLRFAHRWPAGLGLISGALTARLRESLDAWPDTG